MVKIDEAVCSLFLFLVISCCVCCCYGSRTGEDSSSKKDLLEESYNDDENTVKLPVYVVYLFGFGLVLLILLLIFLIFVLIKTKFLEICRKKTRNSENTEMGNRNSNEKSHQKSLKRLNLDRSHSFEFNSKGTQYQTLKENDSSNTLKPTKGYSNTLHTPIRTESSVNQSPRIIKGLTKDMPIILPEQMSQICKEVLTRTNRNDQTTESLSLSVSVQDLNNIAKETKFEEESENKYASSPVLDVYDIPPSALKNDKKRNEKISNIEDIGNQTPIDGNDIYDKPKELNSPNIDDSTILSDNIYDMPKELDNLNKEDAENKKQVLSHNIYDLPKELFDGALNYVKPYFSQTSQDRTSKELKESYKKPDYASLSASCCVKEGSMDKTDATTEQNAYEFPMNSQTEGKMYINANDVVV